MDVDPDSRQTARRSEPVFRSDACAAFALGWDAMVGYCRLPGRSAGRPAGMSEEPSLTPCLMHLLEALVACSWTCTSWIAR